MEHQRKHDRHRPRGWFSLFIRLGGWLSLILGLVLIIMTFIAGTQLYLADKMDREGRFARAAVLEKRIETADDDGQSLRMVFRYKTSEGGREAELEVGQEFYDIYDVGDEVVIRYLRRDPAVVEYEIGDYRKGGDVFRWIGLGFGIAGLWALWFFGQRANRAVMARRDGEKRFAEVTGIEETNVTVNDDPQGRLLWREEDGQTGRSLMRDFDELSRLYKGGDRIVVFRLGEDAFWEGDVGPPRREVRRDS